MNPQRIYRPEHGRASQRGQAMIFVALLLLLGVSAVIYTSSSLTSVSIANRQAEQTAKTLAQVKEALIGWSSSRNPATDGVNARPGELPCPDINPLNGYDDGSCVAEALGRVPWKSLGIPEPKDGAGETLWYAIAGPFRNYNMSSAPITSDTLGNLTVYQGSSGTTLTSQAVAVIFSPGAPLGTQDRDSSTTALCASTGTTIARNLCATNYLDTASSINNATPTANASPPSFIQAQSSSTFNDRVLAITNANLMPAVERRVAREMISILQSYKAATAKSPTYPGGVYPWTDRSNGDSNDWNHNRFPCGTALPVNWNTTVPSSSPSTNTPSLPLWLTNGCTNPVTGWTSVIYYAVARNRLENSGAACTNCTDATLTATNSSNRVADLCPTTGTTCSSTVVSSGSADLILITPGAATASPRGNWPAADFSPITGFFEDAENSGNNNDIYVVPASTNYDRDRIYLVR
ncbi:MAG: hypothetical protein AABM64_10185 [Pseudomonadota bacterium]